MTKNFSLNEMIFSETAQNLGLDNQPSLSVVNNLRYTCLLLERIRKLIGDKPIKVLSGYRSERVNQAVGGSRNSQHCRGQAADIVCPAFGTTQELARIIADNAVLLSVDQVIYENYRGGSTWVHVSSSNNPRYEALTRLNTGHIIGIV